MRFDPREIGEVLEMLLFRELDIRAVTLSVNTLPAMRPTAAETVEALGELLEPYLRRLRPAVEKVASRLGVKIVTVRLAVSPVSILLEPLGDASSAVEIAVFLDKLAEKYGVDFVGGFSAFVHAGVSRGDRALIEGLVDGLNKTGRVAGFLNAASTMTGINLEAVRRAAELVLGLKPHAAARFAVTANLPEDVPFMPGAYHGLGLPDALINVAVSGPGVIESVVRSLPDADVRTLHDAMKRAAFKITRLGELVGREVARELGVPFGAVDLSVAPSPKVGDSVAAVLEAMGLPRVGAPGSVFALALFTDAVKKGGAVASSTIGGLSGAFIPVSEDAVMASAAAEGAVTLDTLKAMAAVCNTGLDMVGIPAEASPDVVAAVIADVMALAVHLDKPLGVRLVPIPGGRPGEFHDLGGLYGKVAVVDVSRYGKIPLMSRGGTAPPGVERLKKG
ncbi:PFL family protein [Pyrobaculum sp. 3827-6]|uniref:PFL family protein n=1 Tax=Pyrobaculum sp. 3827-6 TaxID=2983604 RepID=UPI0021D86F40|nr:PFL family protein [Pyrobaculum sp. 3827-6]MCU7786733.1 PFL family protein [Pyrobaculum sp. 3827-6]